MRFRCVLLGDNRTGPVDLLSCAMAASVLSCTVFIRNMVLGLAAVGNSVLRGSGVDGAGTSDICNVSVVEVEAPKSPSSTLFSAWLLPTNSSKVDAGGSAGEVGSEDSVPNSISARSLFLREGLDEPKSGMTTSGSGSGAAEKMPFGMTGCCIGCRSKEGCWILSASEFNKAFAFAI